MNRHGFKWKGKKVNQFSHKDFQRGRNQATRKSRTVEAQILWTQCELCRKWHELPSFLKEKNLPKEFHCSMNFWNSEYSKCDAEERAREGAREGAIEDDNREDDTSEGQDEEDEEEDTGNSQGEENEDVIGNQMVDEEVDKRDIEETADDEEEAEEQILTTLPNQLYEILENNQFPDIISWTDDGKAFVVHDQERFMNLIYVPKFAWWKDYDLYKFISFEDRMYNWGICHYTKLTDGTKVFYSKDFRKGYQGILHTSQVRRRRRINVPTKKLSAAELAKLVKEPKFTMEAVKRRVHLIIEQNPELLPSNRGEYVIYVWFTGNACFVSESNECYFSTTLPEDINFLFRVPTSAKEGLAQGPPFLLSEKQPWAGQCTFNGVESSKFHQRLLSTSYIRNELGQRSFVVHQGFSRVNARNIENFLQKQLSQREFGTEILWRAFDWGHVEYEEGDENKMFTVGVTVLDASEVKKRLEKGEIIINGHKHRMNQSDAEIYF
ncbi:hypothetical protein CTEN210_03583 [Chaetoceros tenuissimus]|uniref:CW-type domain-containing protein n=1 Tax=Chaetoceros tenuissimus TaxID=426638 RepID=A0AAD3CK15_9STRA|nr:hypothetical protein CTEN210_03583 [Chaetoceros tenuissimus]